VWLLLCACPRLGVEDDADGDTDTDGALDVEAPVFLETADELRIPVTRADDLVLPVDDVVLGLTRVILDGASVGPLSDANRIGNLTGDALTLRLTGAMVPGMHTVRLRTSVGEEPLESRELALDVFAEGPGTPVASIGSNAVLQADVVFATGYDTEGLLVAVDLEASPPVARLHRAAGTGWSLGDRVEIPLDDLHLDGGPRTAVAAHLAAGDLDPADDRVRLAWRAGSEGEALIVADSPWVAPRPMARSVLDAHAIAGSAEYARLGRPLVLGDDVVAEILLATDVEQPHPGDRTLVKLRVGESPVDTGEPQITRIEGSNDIDALSPTIDILGHVGGGPHTFAARVAGVRPVLFTVDRESGELASRVSAANDNLSVLADLAMPMLTVLGAFDSRQVFAPLQGGDAGARVLLWHSDDTDAGGATDASPTADQLAGIGDPTADAVGTLVGGAPIYLVPMGVDAPAYAFVSTGPVPLVGPVDGMQCDEIAVPVSMEANRGDATQVACRRGRDVLLGTLLVP
jgi:hypothetical protein